LCNVVTTRANKGLRKMEMLNTPDISNVGRNKEALELLCRTNAAWEGLERLETHLTSVIYVKTNTHRGFFADNVFKHTRD
jgi:hypothetical protein